MESHCLFRSVLSLAGAGAFAATAASAQEPVPENFDFGVPVQVPFVCENEAHGVSLLPITGEPCQAEPVVKYVYRSQAGEWLDFDPQGERPTDIAETTTNAGALAPLIVRQEYGKLPNGSTYIINILHDPAGSEPTAEAGEVASAEYPSWNGKLIMAYGGGVQANYHSGSRCGLDDDRAYVADGQGQGYQDIFIERGYATMCASLAVMGTNNDDIKSAETTYQVKERFEELYGEPEFTIGVGASGGSMQQLLIANNYPGLLDGIMPKRDYPDGITFLTPLHDNQLLVNALDQEADQYWTEEQKTAVSGYASFDFPRRYGPRYANLTPDYCDAVVIDAVTFEGIAGVRCTYQDNMKYLYGTKTAEGAVDALGNPTEEAAREWFDNVGVQYGLRAFNEGTISFDQFVELNQIIGGLDINGEIQDERSVADEEALRLAYETGRLNQMDAGLAEVPVIDVRRYRDITLPGTDPADMDVHDASHSRTVRLRLIEANGGAGNHVIITAADSYDRGPDTPISAALSRGLGQMDEWLENISGDPRDIPLAQKIAENKPEDLVDSCYVNPTLKVWDAEICAGMFPYHDRPRIVAGGPLTEDVLKCQLKPLDASDYSRSLTDAEWEALRATFSGGVCDWTQPSVGEVPQAGTWLSYTGDSNFTVQQAAAE